MEIKRKNNICCQKTTILLKTSNNDVLLLHLSFIASGSSKNLSDALLNFSTHVLEGFLGNLLKKRNKSLVISFVKNGIFPFLRAHTEGGTNVYHRLVPALRQNWEGRQPISCISRLTFHIFAFWGLEDHFLILSS